MTPKTEVADIAHELRNQLNNISVNAELARLQLQQQAQSDHVMVSVERILNDCKQCSSLLENLSNK